MKQYEYTTGYLLKEHARDINYVTELLNKHAQQGWRFTGWSREVENGQFFMFERKVKVEQEPGFDHFCMYCSDASNHDTNAHRRLILSESKEPVSPEDTL